MTANDLGGDVSVLLGNGDGTFGTHTEYGTDAEPYWVIAARPDGRYDLITANNVGDDVSVLINNSTDQAPTAVAQTASVQENSSSDVLNLLTGDTDPDGDSLLVWSVTTPSHGTATVNNGTVTYTPTTGYAGSDSFSYTIVDGFGGSSTSTVAVTVTAVPITPAQSVSAEEDTTTTFQLQRLGDRDTLREPDLQRADHHGPRDAHIRGHAGQLHLYAHLVLHRLDRQLHLHRHRPQRRHQHGRDRDPQHHQRQQLHHAGQPWHGQRHTSFGLLRRPVQFQRRGLVRVHACGRRQLHQQRGDCLHGRIGAGGSVALHQSLHQRSGRHQHQRHQFGHDQPERHGRQHVLRPCLRQHLRYGLTVTPTPPPAPPTAPTGVAASKNTYYDHIQVSWTAVSTATGYDVYRNTANNSSTATKLNSSTLTTTSYSDTTMTAGTTYYYWVVAKNATGSSPFSSSDYGVCPPSSRRPA